MTSDPADDDTLIERLDEVVEEVLGENLPARPEESDPWVRRERALDAWTAVILGLAALLTAWASYQGGVWANVAGDAQAEASLGRTATSVAISEAGRAELIDSQTWLSWLAAVSTRDVDRAEFLRNRFSPELDRAQEEWLAGTRVNDNGIPKPIPDGTPLDLPTYIVPDRAQVTTLVAETDEALDLSSQASDRSTSFVLVVVVLASSLFLAGIAGKLSSPRTQVLTILASIALLAFGALRIVTLPHTF